jgi:hypothetical protein
MTSFIINSNESERATVARIHALYVEHKYLKVSVKTGKDRSLDQNALSHSWYEQIARELPDYDALSAKCECKLLHGVPILRAEDEEFRQFYDNCIRKSYTYEQKIQAMKYLPVTSEMTTKQLSKYLEAVQAHFLKLNVILEFPKE